MDDRKEMQGALDVKSQSDELIKIVQKLEKAKAIISNGDVRLRAIERIILVVSEVFEKMHGNHQAIIRDGMYLHCKAYFGDFVERSMIKRVVKEMNVGFYDMIEEATLLHKLESFFVNKARSFWYDTYYYIRPRLIDGEKGAKYKELTDKIGKIGVDICKNLKLEERDFALEENKEEGPTESKEVAVPIDDRVVELEAPTEPKNNKKIFYARPEPKPPSLSKVTIVSSIFSDVDKKSEGSRQNRGTSNVSSDKQPPKNIQFISKMNEGHDTNASNQLSNFNCNNK